MKKPTSNKSRLLTSLALIVAGLALALLLVQVLR